MAKTAALSLCLAVASAFQGPAPAGFWDPIGISDNISPEQFQRYREVEQKLGGVVKFSDVPNGVQALFKIPAVGLLQILLLVGILETQFPNENGDYGTGYFGQSLEEPLKSRKLAMEIAND